MGIFFNIGKKEFAKAYTTTYTTSSYNLT